ncbi:phage gp6-like head-tail connector protein [Mycolicibacterium moriokaense]|nr:phage gp6-like head-tail connector protein [Mycolicibacterium moriokaense]
MAGWLGVPNEGTELALACESASRAIDKACNRQFGLVSSPEARWYTAEWYRDRWLITIDDLMTITGLVVELENGDDITEYKLTPINAAPTGRPWTRIEVSPSSAVQPNGTPHGVKVTAKYGWTAVPNAIKQATLIQGARFYDRRENVGGMLTKQHVDDVEYGWAANAGQELDSDVALSLSGYRRLWAAA